MFGVVASVIGTVLGGGNISLPGSLVCIRHCLNSIRCLRPSSLIVTDGYNGKFPNIVIQVNTGVGCPENERGTVLFPKTISDHPARKHVIGHVWTTCPAQQSGTVLNINKRESGVGMKPVSRTSSRSSSSCKYGLNPVSRTNSMLSVSVLRS